MFSGNTCKECARVYKGIIPLVYYGGYIYCTNNMFTVFNGLCTSNMFMVLQVVGPWLYMSYKFCVDIYLTTKIYLSTKIYFIGVCGGRGLTSTLCICILLL